MKYFFVSDVHLVLNIDSKSALEREKLFLEWLEMVEIELKNDNAPEKGALFLLGDIFDFWLEYKTVVPKMYVNVLAKLSKMSADGIKMYFLKGNHDTWTNGYFESIGIEVFCNPKKIKIAEHTIVVGHGHNILISDAPLGYRFLYTLFNSKVALKLFQLFVHPDLSNRFGSWWSAGSRKSKAISHKFKEEQEFVVKYARKELETLKHDATADNIDYFVFGHLHTPIIYNLTSQSNLVVLGQWFENPVYGILTEEGFKLKEFTRS